MRDSLKGVSEAMGSQGRIEVAGLQIDKNLHAVVAQDIAPGTGASPDLAWSILAQLVRDLGPRNRELLAKRDSLQAEIDAWLKACQTPPSPGEWQTYLKRIGYLEAEVSEGEISTTNVDEEIAKIAGPQLVVPLDNARYALNAANARWGSLYDALYGTDVIPESPGRERGGSYNPARGELVVAEVRKILDRHAPLDGASHRDARRYFLEAGDAGAVLRVEVEGGAHVGLANSAQFAGSSKQASVLTNLLIRNNGLYMDIVLDPQSEVGRVDKAGVSDVVIESALSTIMDCEDSVAAVNAMDKLQVYRNWCGLMRGDLIERFEKGGRTIERRLNADREYRAPDGSRLLLKGLSVLLVRHVGAHVYTDAVLDENGETIPETFLDAVITVLGALHDLKGDGPGNSRHGSLYIVKPKQHGSDEVRLSVELFERIEEGFGLPKDTLKIGVMDEERRTTLNLAQCIHAARERLIFINTGFLDRTGDEIHTSMVAGPMLPKPEIKGARWMLAYEDWNVDIGLACGMAGRAQIGKGMWAMPDEMRAMVDSKVGHPLAGANCAWVPSPTAATLHALHYHETDVAERQQAVMQRAKTNRHDLLRPPLLGDRMLSSEEIQRELDNNAQGILGYVVRWVEHGVGCSKVPDIDDVGLMEDRATLRISSQHIANWLHHGLVNDQQVIETMQRMAAVVDRQNQGDPNYRNMAPDFESSVAFQAALDLVFDGRNQPNGYTEHILIRRRREFLAGPGGEQRDF